MTAAPYRAAACLCPSQTPHGSRDNAPGAPATEMSRRTRFGGMNACDALERFGAIRIDACRRQFRRLPGSSERDQWRSADFGDFDKFDNDVQFFGEVEVGEGAIII